MHLKAKFARFTRRDDRNWKRAMDGRSGLVEHLEPRTVLSAGSLDSSFGNNGELAVQFPTGQAITVVRASLVQPDGKILVTGEANDPTGPNKSDFALARLNPDGTPDLGFNNGAGIFVYPSPGNFDEGSGVALQSDGKIVVSATLDAEDANGVTLVSLYVVARFNPDGTLDTAFGDQGAEAINFTTSGNTDTQVGHASDVLVGPDDKITLVGFAAPDPLQSVSNLALARLNADGTPDTTFGPAGADGKVLTSVYGDSELGYAGALDAAGNVLVTGTAALQGNGDANFITARFRPDGSIDPTFGDRGAVTTDFADPSDLATVAAGDAVAVQSDGKIVVGGTAIHADAAANLTAHFALARYNRDGSTDNRFGTDGQTETDLGPVTSINKLLIDPQGRVLASGLAAPTAADAEARQFSAVVAQYTPGGALDPTFGNRGSVLINVNAPVAAASPAASPSAAPAALRAIGDATDTTGVMAALIQGTPADTSQSQQVQNVLARQAAIVVAIRDKLLVIASSSNNQLTAARLIGNGADLAPGTVSGIKPASVLGGAKGMLSVPVVNSGNAPLSGPVTLTVLISSDATADAGDARAASAGYRLNLKPGKGKTLRVRFTYPTGLPDGMYYVLAVADAGSADVNAANNASATTAPVTVAMPFVRLAGTVTAPASLTRGKKSILPLSLQDTGNVPAAGKVFLTVYASSDAAIDAGDQPVAGPAPLRLSLKPGKAKLVRFPLLPAAGLSPGSYFLIASLDESELPLSDLPTLTLVPAGQTSLA